jgi:hypothetical protein
MIVKRHRTNSDFQLAYFIAGGCYTADAAYIALLNQRDERVMALDHARVQAMKNSARVKRIQAELASADDIRRIELQADLLEIELAQPMTDQLVTAAEAELAFIDLCIERVQPLRRYAHLSDAEAAEACQREEFRLEFQHRIENFMITQGQIPAGEFDSMRRHPDFHTHLLPHMHTVQNALLAPQGAQALLSTPTQTFDLPALIGLDQSSKDTHP